MNKLRCTFLKLFFFGSCLLYSIVSNGQSTIDSIPSFSLDSNIIQDKRMTQLVLKHIQINELKKGKTKGFRVQIHFGSEKAKALEVKTKYLTLHYETPVYLDYQQPYFKIRVGDFRTKLEAYKFLQTISGDFPGAFIVSDEIKLPPL